jgi:hypothetical protein
MRFIEGFLGVSPDGGNGATEAASVAAFVLVAVVFICRRISGMRRARRNILRGN